MAHRGQIDGVEIRGIKHQALLRAEGVPVTVVRRWVRTGAVTTVAQWYIRSNAPAGLIALLELGLRPTCLDAASLHGIWTPLHEGTHVFRPRRPLSDPALTGRTAHPLRRRRSEIITSEEAQGLVLHRPLLTAWPDHDPVPDLELVLVHAAHCLPIRKAAVLFESAIHRGKLTLADAKAIVASLPVRLRRPLSRLRPDAESGTETLVRWWLESRRLQVTPQALFPDGRRRMDLLVGRSWVIECDSREFHDDPVSYAEDRARDLYLTSRGYRVTRLSWEQVCVQWEETEKMLLGILGRGDHLDPPRP